MDPRPPRSTSQTTLLLVEDSEKIRPLIRTILSGIGCLVLEASSGEMALQVANTHQGTVDLLFSDISLPGMNGPALAAELRKRYPGMHVLYMSGSGLPAEAHNNAHFVEKPFDPDTLLIKINEILRE